MEAGVAYDRYGNRWEQTVVAGGGYGGSFSFDSANNRITATGFTYDGSGNLTANGPLTSYTYNAENFLTAAGASVTYQYDAQGRRVRKTVGNSVTDYFYSGSEVIAEKQDTIWTDSIFFGDQRMAQQTGATHATTTYLHADHLGSMRVCTDASGLNNNGNWTCDYEPFGEMQPGSTCAVPTNYGFAGAEYDPETGLYHFWFRQYDPNQGRWMSVDPEPGSPGDPQSLNRYPYVRNAPVNFTDPLGLSHEPWLLEYEVPHDADPQSETLRALLYGLPSSAIRCSLDGISISCGHLLGRLFSGGRSISDLVRAALTPTGYRENPACPNGDCARGVPRYLPVFGNIGLLRILNIDFVWWRAFSKDLFSLESAKQAQQDAWRKGYYQCLSNEMLRSGGLAAPAVSVALKEAAIHGVSHSPAPEIAAGAYYRFTDGRFTAWGKFSKVLVPQAAGQIRSVLRLGSVASLAYGNYQLAKAIQKCSGSL